MATRFKLPASGAAAVSPAMQSYTHTQATRRPLPTSDSTTLATQAYTPDAADHLVAGDAHHVQFVSGPLGAQTISAQTVKLCLQALEDHTNNNLFIQLWIGVVSNDGATALATLLAKTLDDVEIATALTSRIMSATTSAYTISAANVGARLVVEISVSGTPAASSGTQGHNAQLRFGASGAGGDLLENDTQTGTTLNPWLEFANTLTFVSAGFLVASGGNYTIDTTGPATAYFARSQGSTGPFLIRTSPAVGAPIYVYTDNTAVIGDVAKPVEWIAPDPAGGLSYAGAATTIKVSIRTYSPSGGLLFAGAAALLKTKIGAVAGGLTYSGVGSRIKEKIGAVAGGLTLGGSAAHLQQKIYTSVSGGLVFAGAGTTSHFVVRTYSAAGGLVFAGIGTVIKEKLITGSGGLSFSGAATRIKEKIGAVSGGLTFAGSASLLKEKIGRVSGGLTFAGDASPTHYSIRTYTVDGGLVLSGAAVVAKDKIGAVAGGLTFSGVGAIAVDRSFTAGGGLQFGSGALLEKEKVGNVGGGLVFDGAAALSKEKLLSGLGGYIFGGAAASSFENAAIVSLRAYFMGGRPVVVVPD